MSRKYEKGDWIGGIKDDGGPLVMVAGWVDSGTLFNKMLKELKPLTPCFILEEDIVHRYVRVLPSTKRPEGGFDLVYNFENSSKRGNFPVTHLDFNIKVEY